MKGGKEGKGGEGKGEEGREEKEKGRKEERERAGRLLFQTFLKALHDSDVYDAVKNLQEHEVFASVN